MHGSGALAPSGQNEPGSQATHVCSPPLVWYVPAAHLSQVPCSAMGWTVPGLHLVCSMLPVGAKEPASVFVHSLGLVRLIALEYEPSLHDSAALAPSGQYEPGVHDSHISWPGVAWKVPASHLRHEPMLALGATVPGLQGVCSVLPVGAKWPLSVSVHSLRLVRLTESEYEPGKHGSATEVPLGQ